MSTFVCSLTVLVNTALAETKPPGPPAAATTGTTAPPAPPPPVGELTPEPLHRVSRLLEMRKLTVAYDLCGPKAKNRAIPVTAKIVNDVYDALDSVGPSSDPVRLRAIGERLDAALGPLTEPTLDDSRIPIIKKALEEIKSTPDVSQGPPRAATAGDPKLALHAAAWALAGKLQTEVEKTPNCDPECRSHVVQSCGRALSPPVEERVPPTGGLAWTVRPLRELSSDAVKGDPTRGTWLFRRFDRMCQATALAVPGQPPGSRASRLFPESCRVATDYGEEMESFPGVLFAAGVRADLESMPSKLGEVDSRAVDAVLLTLMQRVRMGDTPLAMLSGLSNALGTKTGGLRGVVARASELVSYLGDALAIEDLSELERGLPILSTQFLRYWAVKNSPDKPAAPAQPPAEGTTSLAPEEESVAGLTAAKVSRVAREVYVLNQITLSASDERDRDAADLGYRQLTAMLRALDVAVGVIIQAEPSQQQEDLKRAWSRSLAVAEAGALMLVGRYPEGALALTRRSKDRLPTSVNPIIPLAVAVATQQTPSGVASALEAGTQRVTVWDLRAETVQFSFSGQFGIAATADSPTSKAGGAGWAYVLGLTLPLGVGLSIPAGGTYISLQLTMLDAAQLAAIPLAKKTGTVQRGEETLDVTPSPTTKLRPEQVLAPGLFFGVAWPKTALLLAFGGSVAPRLREYEVTNTNGLRVNAEQRTVYRVGAKMVVDVPFLEFF